MTAELPIDPSLKRLIEAHPSLFRGQAPAVSSYVCEGWYDLIDQLCTDIAATLAPEVCARVTVRQIKEKFGELRFYVRFDERADFHVDFLSPAEHVHAVLPAAASGDTEQDAQEKRVRELIMAAIKKSESTCETCGAPGEPRNIRGWFTTLCGAHLAEALAKAEAKAQQGAQNQVLPTRRVLVLSDLHLELGTSYTLPQGLEFDMVVLAGDIQAPGRKAVIWAQRQAVFAGKPVVLVPGYHEYYGAPSLHRELEAMRELATGSNVHVLDRDVVIIDGVRFVGCTLWTDFQLPIHLPLEQGVKGGLGLLDTNVAVALSEANRRLNDFELIQVMEPVSRQNRYREFKRPLRAEDTLAMHWVDRDWLRRALKEPFDGPTVVVTHHAPSPLSVDPKYDGDRLTPAFASNLPKDFFDIPELWIHGHTHSSARYTRRGALNLCEVVSNPRGYRMKDGTFENTAFNPGLMIDARRLRW